MKPCLHKSNMGEGFSLKPCTTSRESLAEIVGSLEELITEILIRVPVKPLFRFKCVSKSWLSLISNPKFCERHTLQNPNPPVSAVFHYTSENFSSVSLRPGVVDWDPLSVISNQYGRIDIINSCNGLFLCCRRGENYAGISTCFVLNPTTNKFLTLTIPKPAEPSLITGCSLAFDPSKSPHYKVICIDTIHDEFEDCWHFKILIYSSENRTWRQHGTVFDRHPHIDYQRGVYLNGAIHWLGLFSEVSYFLVDEERVKVMKSTPHFYMKKWQDMKYCYFKESIGGHLHLIEIYKPCLTKFEVLEMGRDYSGWFVKYNVDLDPLCASFPAFRYGIIYVLFLDRNKNEEDDSSSLFLHVPGHVISCDLKCKTFKSFELAADGTRFLVRDHNFLYRETLACV